MPSVGEYAPELEKLSTELEKLSTSELEKLSIPDLEKILDKLSTSKLQKLPTPESEILSKPELQEVSTPELEKLSTPERNKEPTPVFEAFIGEEDDEIKFNIKPDTPVVITRKQKRQENSPLNLVSSLKFIWYLYRNDFKHDLYCCTWRWLQMSA